MTESADPSYDVAIQKVLEVMKAIVDAKLEPEFLRECLTLQSDRFVVVGPKIVHLVKDFLAKHGLEHKLRHDDRLSPLEARTMAEETCFEHRN
ncbi:hypothetical protein [Rhodopseudomonas telluris]|uniref:Uncharacterized protein n=1 Tax=Rhodopseudomonas telluris TaxID=644215 RepID=A0ABV6EXG4_9BRAD